MSAAGSRGATGYPLKGVPIDAGTSSYGIEPPATGWNLLGEETEFPLIVLKQQALEHNVALMARYCADHGVSLAPHGKTTLSPQLIGRQLSAGAWAITVANVWQACVVRAMGVGRVLIANEVVDRASLRWLHDEQRADPAFEVFMYVDSVRGVELAEAALADLEDASVQVLVEFGYLGGRAGCRTAADAVSVAERVQASPVLSLAGVAGFEGLMSPPKGIAVEVVIGDFLRTMGEVVERVHDVRPWPADAAMIVTAGGSAYFDIVVQHLGPQCFSFPVHTVLRSGCYVTHDSEMYEITSPLAGRAEAGAARLQAAAELWATVISRPVPTLAIVGFGKRDAPYDYGLPVPLAVRPHGAPETRDFAGEHEYVALNDQHAFLRIEPGEPLQVGDQVVSGISHPCGIFDKWRVIPIVDGDYQVVEHAISLL